MSNAHSAVQGGEHRPLPAWRWGVLGDVLAKIETGKSFRCDERPPRDGEVGIIKVSAVTWGEYDEAESKTCFEVSSLREDYLICPGDFLFSRANTLDLIGACVVVRKTSKRLMLSDKILRFVFKDVLPAFALWYLRSPDGRSEIQRLSTGNQESMRNIGQDRIRQIRFPIVDMRTQQEVLAQAEARLSRLDKAKADLRSVEVKLTRHRASVLAAATSGSLVPTEAERARREGRSYEPASVLIDRILAERRARWEAEQIAAFRARGLNPRDDKWKAKYQPPVAPDIIDLPELPEGWMWTSMDHLLADIEAGASFQCEERKPTAGEIGVLKVSSVTWGEYDENETKTCTTASRIDKSLFIQPGDFLFSRANTIELVGACAIAKRVTFPAMLSDKTLRFRFVDEAVAQWVLTCLRSKLGRTEIQRLATGNQESMRNIGQGRIRSLRIPMPPAGEMCRLIPALEQYTLKDERLAVAGQRASRRAVSLRSAILQSAFQPPRVTTGATHGHR